MRSEIPQQGSQESKQKRLLLLCATTGYQTRAFVEAAEKLGLEVAFGSDRCRKLDDPWQDGALPLRFENPSEAARSVVDYARSHPIDALAALGDRATPTAALACREMGLAYNSPEAAEACRNKYRSRLRLEAAGLKVPPFRRFSIGENPQALASGVEFPCVLKPLALSGSRGVIRADNPPEFIAAFERIKSLLLSPGVQVLREETSRYLQVERFIDGREYALEGLLMEGGLKVLALFDKPDPLEGPYFEETLYVTPSRLGPDDQQRIVEAVQKATAALGLSHGSVHAEARLNAEGVWILEVAARSIGGLCARSLRFEQGMSLEELILRHALGEDVSEVRREHAASGVMMIPIPHEGLYEGVEGEEEAGRTPGVEEIRITAKPQQKLVPLPEGASYLGFIFSRADTPAKVEESLRQAHKMLRFRISTVLQVM